MIILPPFEDFLKACNGSLTPAVTIKQAAARQREILNDDDAMDEETAQHAMTYAICEELLSTYHSWLGGQLASPDLKEL